METKNNNVTIILIFASDAGTGTIVGVKMWKTFYH